MDIRFDIRLILIQVGYGIVRFRAGDESEVDAFTLVDHLVIDTESGLTSALAGVDSVTLGDALSIRLVRWILCSGNDPHFRVNVSDVTIAKHDE